LTCAARRRSTRDEAFSCARTAKGAGLQRELRGTTLGHTIRPLRGRGGRRHDRRARPRAIGACSRPGHHGYFCGGDQRVDRLAGGGAAIERAGRRSLRRPQGDDRRPSTTGPGRTGRDVRLSAASASSGRRDPRRRQRGRGCCWRLFRDWRRVRRTSGLEHEMTGRRGARVRGACPRAGPAAEGADSERGPAGGHEIVLPKLLQLLDDDGEAGIPDLFVPVPHRARRRQALLARRLGRAVRGARRQRLFEWVALDWRACARFYRRIGAGEMEQWITHRL